MSRFSNLEFDAHEEELQAEEEQARDEKYYQAMAEERFWGGDYEQSLRFYSRALEFDRRQPAAWLGQVLSLVELDEPHEGRVWADKALELFGGDAELLAGKAIAVVRLGDVATALALTDAAISERGTSALRWRARGEVMLPRDTSNANYCFQKALAEDPSDWRAPLAIGRACLFHHRWALATEFLVKATDLQSSSAWAWANRGVAHEMLAQTDKARKAYTTALQIDRQQQLATNRMTALDSASITARITRWWRARRQR